MVKVQSSSIPLSSLISKQKRVYPVRFTVARAKPSRREAIWGLGVEGRVQAARGVGRTEIGPAEKVSPQISLTYGQRTSPDQQCHITIQIPHLPRSSSKPSPRLPPLPKSASHLTSNTHAACHIRLSRTTP